MRNYDRMVWIEFVEKVNTKSFWRFMHAHARFEYLELSNYPNLRSIKSFCQIDLKCKYKEFNWEYFF